MSKLLMNTMVKRLFSVNVSRFSITNDACIKIDNHSFPRTFIDYITITDKKSLALTLKDSSIYKIYDDDIRYKFETQLHNIIDPYDYNAIIYMTRYNRS